MSEISIMVRMVLTIASGVEQSEIVAKVASNHLPYAALSSRHIESTRDRLSSYDYRSTTTV
jgi:hypothetical protein